MRLGPRGHVLQEKRGLRRDAVRRNDVAGNGAPSERIGDGFLTGKIARAHGGSGKNVVENLRFTLLGLFHIGEEEDLVLDDGTADRAAELVAPERVLSACKEVSRVDLVVADKLECVPWNWLVPLLVVALTKFGVCPYSAGMLADSTLNSSSASTLG